MTGPSPAPKRTRTTRFVQLTMPLALTAASGTTCRSTTKPSASSNAAAFSACGAQSPGGLSEGTSNQLGQEPLGVAAVRGDERMDRAGGVGQETPMELRGGVNDAMNRARTRAPAATSASVTASAGLWLIPPVQRTNSMPIGAMAMIAMPS